MAKAAGIEIGETAVVVAELDGSPKKFRLTAAARVPIANAAPGEERRKAEVAALKQALKQSKAGRDQITLGVPSSAVIIREIQLPFADEEQIKKVIKFESESHLHGCDIDDVVVGYHRFGVTGGKSRILIFAVRKDDLKSALDVVGRAGIDPLHVTLDAAGLHNLFRAMPEGQSNLPNVLLDVGERTTTAVVTTEDKVRLVRSIRIGTESITRAVAADLGTDATTAAAETRAFADAAARPFALAGEAAATQGVAVATKSADLKRELIREGHGGFAQRLAGEISRSLSSVLLDGRLEAITLAGVGAGAPGLEAELAKTFGVPVRRLDPATAIENKLKGDVASGVATAAGLALVGLGQNSIGLEFRQEEFKFARTFDRVRSPLLLALVATFIVLFFLCLGEHVAHTQLGVRVGFLGNEAQTLARNYLLPMSADPEMQRIVGQKNPDEWKKLVETAASVDAPRIFRQTTAKASDEITKNYGVVPGEKTAAADNLTTSALVRLAEFMKTLQVAKDKIGPFTVDKLNVSEFDITWTMTVQESSRWDTLKTEFEALPSKPTAGRGADRPFEGGLRVLENCRLEWKRAEDR